MKKTTKAISQQGWGCKQQGKKVSFKLILNQCFLSVDPEKNQKTVGVKNENIDSKWVKFLVELVLSLIV